MIEFERIEDLCERLALGTMATQLSHVADQAAREGGLTNTPETRIPGSTHAVMYALDAYTGKELWSSGDQITSWGHFTGLSLANGRVYFGTYDSTLYCFGIKK